ncbi:ATP-binding protein [Sphaerisporangium sp. NPDC005288]|uniref:ATP-binding protein n=1 Tax=Sphaerisporangium sp. NPDC005288 TaxID=3155114 RepID=UPI0033BEDDF1
MTLIGRRGELAAVERLLDRAAAGTGGHLVVSGPPGSGKTALAGAAARLARARGIPVIRAAATGPASAPPFWTRLLDDLGTHDAPGSGDGPDGDGPDGGGPDGGGTSPGDGLAELDQVARLIARGGPRLVLVEDADRDGAPSMALLNLLAARLGAGATALVVTARDPLGLTPELRLGGLAEPELAELVADLPAEAVHAVWLASGGLPGPALALAAGLAGSPAAGDAVAQVALAALSGASFLDLDVGLIRVLEDAAERALPPATRARVLARLARELLGDASAAARRRELIGEAVALARTAGDPGTLAEVLDCRLHALWDPAAADERLAAASEIIERARRAGDAAVEGRGLFWRFTALCELGDLASAEAALTAYARAGELAGDAEAAVVVLARQSMLATIRGRFDAAEDLAREVVVRGGRAGLNDTGRLAGSLRASLAALRGQAADLVEPWQALARRLPGHFFEAAAARTLAESGRGVEAELELERLLPAVLAGSGPRWLGVAADLAVVASLAGEPAPAEALYEALLPYQGRLVVWGGANTITGPVDDYLGRLAARLGRPDRAVGHLDAAAALGRRVGALPWLARTLVARAQAMTARGGEGDHDRAADDLARARSIAGRLGMNGVLATLEPPADEWRLRRDGDGWSLEAGAETARLRDGRGMHYLRALLAAPGREIPALDLVSGGAGLRAPGGDPVLDDAARAAYRRRLETLDRRLDEADRVGDSERAAALQQERTALVGELRRATGLGGRPRAQAGEAERARVNATRTLWAAVERVESAAPLAGAHLRASLRTGRLFRYQPAPGGPARWRV